MPQYSSKNYYKAELEEYDALQEKEWEYWEQMYHRTKYDRHSWYYNYEDYTWSSAFNTNWTKHIGSTRSKKCMCCNKNGCAFTSCSCDYCYEMKCWSFKEIVKKYFTPQQILEYNSSVSIQHQKFYCTKCEQIYQENVVSLFLKLDGDVKCRTKTFYPERFSYSYCNNRMIACPIDKIITKSNLYKYILSDRRQPLKIEEINMDMISNTTLEYFMDHHRKNILEYHEQQKQRDQIELLNKYGLTMKDYTSYRLRKS